MSDKKNEIEDIEKKLLIAKKKAKSKQAEVEESKTKKKLLIEEGDEHEERESHADDEVVDTKELSTGSGLHDLAKVLTGEVAAQEAEEKRKKQIEKKLKAKRVKLRNSITKHKTRLRKTSEFSEDELEILGFNKSSVIQKIDIYDWTVPERMKLPFEKKSFLVAVAAAMFFQVYLAILGHYGLMMTIIAVLFLIYVLGTTEPRDVTYILNTKGLEIYEKLYEWYMLEEFWFAEKSGYHLLHVETKLKFPNRVTLIVEEDDVAPLFVLLQDKLLYRDIKKQNRFQKLMDGTYISVEEI